jgi:hypothetical protein
VVVVQFAAELVDDLLIVVMQIAWALPTLVISR